MRRYRTEIHIPPDRTIVLHLPPDLPEGRAIITVQVEEPEAADALGAESDPDRQDIEWWEEFEDDADDPADVGSPTHER